MVKYRGPKKLRSIVESCASKCIKKEVSKIEIRLLLNWRNIVGSEISRVSEPEKVVFYQNTNSGILHLLVTNSSMALQIQHLSLLIIEKITVFFGYKAVYDIKIKQRPNYDKL
ncbi:DUF721 domain-containing protein [Candidatus Mesenet endosymbiont of Agriotes lineatus]|uniref:DUF721 domain-containing protein n=1 Tax=Candidatus Mesenet endosymbiont of Agriotes lineatus TaxID=3077948 RepID=UPI0030CB1ECC